MLQRLTQTLTSAVFGLLLSLNAAAETTWIDVRTTAEFEADHLASAHHIPLDTIEMGVLQLGLEKDAEIVLYCGAGGRAESAKLRLEQLGYSQVRNAGGLADARALRDGARACEENC